MRCIYCHQADSPSHGREHVIPQSLGTFTPSSLILEDVCDLCNNVFSKLETIFKEDSVEGFIAAQYQFRSDSSIRFRRDRMKFRNRITGEQRIFDDMFPTLDPETGNAIPTPQVVIHGKNGYSQVIFVKGLKDAKGFAKRIRWTGEERASIRIFAKGDEQLGELISELRNRGLDYKELQQERLELQCDGQFDCEFDGRLDREVMRVIAKIAFNYFAYCAIKSGFLNLLFEDEFRSIRDFVLLDSGKNPVVATKYSVGMKGQEHRPHIPFHFIRVSERRGRIVAELALFGHMKYVVDLAAYPFRTVSPSAFGFGHQFDLVKKTFYREDPAQFCLGNSSDFNIFSNVAGIKR
ncbi:MAG: hypothetical protein HY986_10575 [Candidatus Melainabacteria bacterium]|nr:hypothetical protein [Candidatus Melainabacteria bacterium]